MCICVCVFREIYSKKLAHKIMETCKSKICTVGPQAGDLG